MQQGRLFPTRDSRRCIRCGTVKPLSEFAWREKAKGRRFAHCRGCQSIYFRKHYEKNRQVYIERNARTKRRILEERWDLLVEFLAKHGCVDCGETDVMVLEFDHLSDKEFDISVGMRKRGWSAVLEEIEKCEVVCGNCHRRRTARRAGHWRANYTE